MKNEKLIITNKNETWQIKKWKNGKNKNEKEWWKNELQKWKLKNPKNPDRDNK